MTTNPRLVAVLLVVAAQAWFAGPPPSATAQGEPPEGGGMASVRKWLAPVGHLGGPTRAVAVAGTTAYVGVGPRLVALDVSQPDAPRKLAESPVLPGLVWDVALSGGYAIVTTTNIDLVMLFIAGANRASADHQIASHEWIFGSVHVIDLSNGDPLPVVATVERLGSEEFLPTGVLVEDGIAYVSTLEDGVRVFDVSDPTRPRETGVVPIEGAWDVAAVGSRGYAAGPDGIYEFDGRDPGREPRLLFPTSSIPLALEVAGNIVYVADLDIGLHSFDASDPEAEPARFGAAVASTSLAVVGSTLYAADLFEGLRVFDISGNSPHPQIGRVQLPGLGGRVVVAAGAAYVATGSNGLHIVDVTDPSAPYPMGEYTAAGRPLGVAVAGTTAYVADSVTGVSLWDIADPVSPHQIGGFGAANARRIAVDGDHLYVVSGTSGLRIVNVTNPRRTREIAAFVPEGLVVGAAVWGGAAYVAESDEFGSGRDGVHVLDVSSPERPVVVGFLEADEDEGVHDVFVVSSRTDGDRLYIAANSSLRIMDVSRPTAPQDIGTYWAEHSGWRTGGRVAVDGVRAYFSPGSEGLDIVDVSDPVAPVEIGFHPDFEFVDALAASGATVLAALGDFGDGPTVDVLDVRDAAEPRLLDTFRPTFHEVAFEEEPPSIQQIVLSGDLALFPVPGLGVTIMRVVEATTRVYLPQTARSAGFGRGETHEGASAEGRKPTRSPWARVSADLYPR